MTWKLFFAASVHWFSSYYYWLFCNKHAPLRTMRVRGDQTQWMTEEIRTAMKTCGYLKHKLQKNKVTKLIDEAKDTY